MAASLNLFKLSFLLSLFSNSNVGVWHGIRSSGGATASPITCSRIECPSYEVVHAGNGYAIRRYNTTAWVSTSPIQDISLVEATRTGFLQLFDYIQGKNNYEEKIEMTAPVISQVLPSDGPFCASSFVVSFYVPKQNQANPPPAKGLHVQRWAPTYAAVRQFSGFVSDYDVGEEAATLHNSLAGTTWAAAIDKSHADEAIMEYIVAQYNSPFEFEDRVNEIWLMFEMESDSV
ncbi:SOUL heme-binding family protein [Actinidia rufa]|uniref:SOUL heme-binding family protein n=1 Tax=Actinidia rufa TaxID=165716 RepID=A0A7J0GNH4_9ERIC|nr:SOUL heme-binding family protein [Actinidia rufa]